MIDISLPRWTINVEQRNPDTSTEETYLSAVRGTSGVADQPQEQPSNVPLHPQLFIDVVILPIVAYSRCSCHLFCELLKKQNEIRMTKEEVIWKKKLESKDTIISHPVWVFENWKTCCWVIQLVKMNDLKLDNTLVSYSIWVNNQPDVSSPCSLVWDLDGSGE